ncbi:hypothetical protein ILUMI_19381, partial [Ignelater luminosus]
MTLIKDFESPCKLPTTFKNQLTESRLLKYQKPFAEQSHNNLSHNDDNSNTDSKQKSTDESDNNKQDVSSEDDSHSSSDNEDSSPASSIQEETQPQSSNDREVIGVPAKFELPVDAMNAVVSLGGVLVESSNFTDPLQVQTKTSSSQMIYMFDDDFVLNALPPQYIPIIPTILVDRVNKAVGVFPKYNPRKIISSLISRLDGKDILPIEPWHKDFEGTIKDNMNGNYTVTGIYSEIQENIIKIELPLGTVAEEYRLNILEDFKRRMVISRYEEIHTDTGLKFNITFPPGKLTEYGEEEGGIVKLFNLKKDIPTKLIAFNKDGNLKT